MKHHYYVGFASGTSKKTGKPWYALRVLGDNQFGNLDISPIFLKDDEEYQRLQKEAPPFGSAVSITCDQFGSIIEFKAVEGVPKLNLQ